MRSDEIAERLRALVAKGEKLRAAGGSNSVPSAGFAEWASQSAALLKSVAGPGHTYPLNFEQTVRAPRPWYVENGLGILRAAAEDLDLGLLRSFRELVAAEVFGDFLDMAKHLFEAGYAIPAASLAGAVLEDGLRRIAASRDVKVKAGDDLSTLNHKLADANVYNRLEQKRIQVWIDVRNRADHGEFDEVRTSDVLDFLAGVEAFLGAHL